MKWTLLTILLAGCATAGSVTTTKDFCAGWRPIVLDGSSIDGLTERDAQAVLAHNEFGRAEGCW